MPSYLVIKIDKLLQQVKPPLEEGRALIKEIEKLEASAEKWQLVESMPPGSSLEHMTQELGEFTWKATDYSHPLEGYDDFLGRTAGQALKSAFGVDDNV